MAYVAGARTQETGIRIALGAKSADVANLVMGRGAVQIAVGVILGVGIALYVSRGISRLVFQMSPWDPWVLVVSFAVLTATGLLATWLPARKAMRVDPLVALRTDP